MRKQCSVAATNSWTLVVSPRRGVRREWSILMTEPRNIVVIGGGFAGTTLARELDAGLPPGFELILISEES